MKKISQEDLEVVQSHPSFKKYFRIDTWEIIKLMLTPFSVCYTNYQWALLRLIKKSRGKLMRELEAKVMIKRIRDSYNLCSSFEKQDLFYGLQKKYKYHYNNTVNVSLMTEESIQQEHIEPYPPNETVYQRKKMKYYASNEAGDAVYGKMMLEPFELREETVDQIATMVTRKIKMKEHEIMVDFINRMFEKAKDKQQIEQKTFKERIKNYKADKIVKSNYTGYPKQRDEDKTMLEFAPIGLDDGSHFTSNDPKVWNDPNQTDIQIKNNMT